MQILKPMSYPPYRGITEVENRIKILFPQELLNEYSSPRNIFQQNFLLAIYRCNFLLYIFNVSADADLIQLN